VPLVAASAQAPRSWLLSRKPETGNCVHKPATCNSQTHTTTTTTTFRIVLMAGGHGDKPVDQPQRHSDYGSTQRRCLSRHYLCLLKERRSNPLPIVMSPVTPFEAGCRPPAVWPLACNYCYGIHRPTASPEREAGPQQAGWGQLPAQSPGGRTPIEDTDGGGFL